MFTGIIQATGTVRSVRQEPPVVRLVLDAPELTAAAGPITIGASVCVSGACLTVTAVDDRSLSFDVIPETLARTTLGDLRPGNRVNLEPSLRAGDRMDGHVVQGHVDGTARVREVATGSEGHVVHFEIAPDLMPFVIPKGSIAIDGVSLTIASVDGDTFAVALIPTTLAMTTLGALRAGDRVNIETDILARTVVATLHRWRAGDPPVPQEMDEERGSLLPSTPQPVAVRQQVAALPGSRLTVDSLRENGW